MGGIIYWIIFFDIPAINSQGEPDVDYVKWLEDLIDVYQLISKKSSDISPIISENEVNGVCPKCNCNKTQQLSANGDYECLNSNCHHYWTDE